MFTLKHLKTLQYVSILFRSSSVELLCSLLKLLCRTAVRHTSSHRTHVHTPNVMLPHHYIDFYILNKF